MGIRRDHQNEKEWVARAQTARTKTGWGRTGSKTGVSVEWHLLNTDRMTMRAHVFTRRGSWLHQQRIGLRSSLYRAWFGSARPTPHASLGDEGQ